jgi:hypothetical protein
MRLGKPCRALDAVHRRIRRAEPDIAGHALVEEMHVLRDIGDELAQDPYRQVAEVATANADPAAPDVPEAEEQIGACALARAGSADQRHRLAGPQREGDAVQHGPAAAALIGEADCLEADRGVRRPCAAAVIGNGGALVENGKDARRAGAELAELARGLGDLGDGGERPGRQHDHQREEGAIETSA